MTADELEHAFLKPLNIAQRVHLQTLLWLLDDYSHRRTGRTHLMAVAYILIALRHPGRRIYVHHILGYIQMLLEPLRKYVRLDTDSERSFSIEPTE